MVEVRPRYIPGMPSVFRMFRVKANAPLWREGNPAGSSLESVVVLYLHLSFARLTKRLQLTLDQLGGAECEWGEECGAKAGTGILESGQLFLLHYCGDQLLAHSVATE